jgi:hypothetical protein
MGYIIKKKIWKEIGATTAVCSTTIPLAFGASILNIELNQSYMTTEMWTNWTLYIIVQEH